MKSNTPLLLLLGSLLYLASPTLCQLQIRHGKQTATIGGTTYYYASGTTYYYSGSTTCYLTSGGEGIISYTITSSQAPATVTGSKVPTTITIDSQPAVTTVTIPQAPATTVTNYHPPLTTVTTPRAPATTVTTQLPATTVTTQLPATTVTITQAPTTVTILQPPRTTVTILQPPRTTVTISEAPVTTVVISQPAATTTVSGPQAPATTVTNSQPPDTTTVSGPQPPAKTVTNSQPPDTTTVSGSQAPAITVTSSQPAATTTVSGSQAPAITVTSSQPAATTTVSSSQATTTVTNSQPAATTTVSGSQAPAITVTSSQPAATTTVSGSQAPAITVTSSQPAATTTVSGSQVTTTVTSSQPTATTTASRKPIATTFSTRTSAAAASTATFVSTVTVSGTTVSITYSSGVSSRPTTRTSAPPAAATGRGSRDLRKLILDALGRVPNLGEFTNALIDSKPDVFEMLDPESDYTIFAADDDAMKREREVGGLRRKRAQEGKLSPQLALSFAKRGLRDPPLTSGPRTLNTSLTDQEYVNLGPGEPARIVSLPLDQDLNIAPGAGAYLSIVSGIGRNHTVTLGDQKHKFEAGEINVVNSLQTLPVDLSTALRNTSGTEFEKFLSSSGQLDILSSSPRVTIFALDDAAMASAGNLTSAVLNQHVIRDFAGYTPSFNLVDVYNTTNGNAIKVTKLGSSYFVNGVRIVKPDVIIKNGVVHYVERIIGPYTSPRPPPPSADDAQNIAGRSSVSPFIAILAAVVAFTRCCLMA